MNKNWLYRVLAVALVAMLALPMFAMAEEKDAFQLGANGEATAVELMAKESWDPEIPTVVVDFDSSLNLTLDVDLGNEDHFEDYYLVNATEEFLDDDFTYYKSSNTKVATLDKHGHLCIKTTGKSTITVKGKNSDGKIKTKKIKLDVTNSRAPKSVVILNADDGDKDVSKSTISVSLGDDTKEIINLKTQVKDKWGDEIENEYPDSGSKTGVATLRSNKTKVAQPLTKDETTGKRVDDYDNEYAVEVDVSATGSAKLTATVLQDQKITTYTNIKISKHSKEQVVKKQLDLELSRAKSTTSVVVGVKDAKIVRVKKEDGAITDWYYDVTLYICNGIGHTIKKIVPDGTEKIEIQIGDYKGATLQDLYDATPADATEMGDPVKKGKELTVNWKNNKVSTMKITVDSDHFVKLSDAKVGLFVMDFKFKEKSGTNVLYKGE